MLVEDHILMRMGLITATQVVPDMEVVAEVNNGDEVLESFRKAKPDVVLVDLRLPGMDGIQVIRALRKESAEIRIVVLSSYATGEDINQAMHYGASGYVLKSMSIKEVLEAVRVVHLGGQYIPREIASRLNQHLNVQLSTREIEVLQLIAKGRSNKEIASELGIVEGTVKAHITNIFAKLSAVDRAQAVSIAIKNGILHLE